MVDSLGRGFKEYAPLVLRIGIAVIFGLAGVRGMAHAGDPGDYIVPALELLGALLVLLGLLTRYAAGLLVVMTFVAIIPRPGWNVITERGDQIHLALIVMCFALFCLGGGRVSMDLRRQRQKSNET